MLIIGMLHKRPGRLLAATGYLLSATCKTLGIFLVWRVSRIWHSVYSNFAECLIIYTRWMVFLPSARHLALGKALGGFPVVSGVEWKMRWTVFFLADRARPHTVFKPDVAGLLVSWRCWVIIVKISTYISRSEILSYLRGPIAFVVEHVSRCKGVS